MNGSTVPETTTIATDVLIVGAGLAGLYAARLLHRAGLTITVLDARDRVGGRVSSHRLADGTYIDLGAQWIGPGQRRIYALAREFGLATIETHTQGDALVEMNRRLRRASGGTPPLSWLAGLDALQFSWRINRIANKLSITEPWTYPEARRLDSISFTVWLQANTFSEEARIYWRYIVEAGMCVSADDLSPLEVLQQVASIGGLGPLETAEQEFFEGGAQAIAQRLADELDDCLRLRTPVRALHHDHQSIRAITEQGEFWARRVILALPPQLIAEIVFEPDFPRQPCQQGRSLLLGQVIKNVVVYDHAWWRAVGLSGTATTPDGPIDFFVDTSNRSGRPGVLVALATGSRVEILRRMHHDARESAVLAHIQRLFGEAPSPPRYFFSKDWTSDPWSRGGYASHRAIGDWTDRKNRLTAPCGPIHFAGSETADEWRSYMEGALQSAERASAEVTDSLC